LRHPAPRNEPPDNYKQILHKPADYSAGFCRGFIEAVLDMNDLHLLTARLNNAPSRSPMCIPASVGWDQLRKVVLKYMNDHPEQLHLRARNIVLDSISPAFPCKNENNPSPK
jgi:hypothetical protein